jgi:RNA polymerase sigma-70 factor (ECF subfamily)
MLFFYLAMIESLEERDKCDLLYRTYRRLLVGVATNILHDGDLAEDAVQQAFVKLIPNLGKIRDVSSHQTKNFLVIMVRRVCFDFYNEQKKIIQIPYEDLGEEDDTFMSDTLERNLDYAELQHKMELLPDIYRDALYLYYCEDYAVNDIARMFDVSIDAMKKRLERGRQHLRALLLEEVNV